MATASSRPASSAVVPDKKEIERCLAAGASAERKRFQSPDRHSVEREFGKDNVKDDPSTPGGWVCTIKHDKQKMLRAEAMMKGVRKEDAERGRIVQDAIEKESVTMPDGSVRPIYGHLLDGVRQKFKKGLRGVGKYGKAPSEYFGLQGSYGKYEQGPEGLTFVWNDGWEPTNLWAEKAVGDVQHDPDGNVWVRSGDDWVLESEV